MTVCKIIVGAGAVCTLEINYKNGLSQSKGGFLAAVGHFVRDNFFFLSAACSFRVDTH